MRKGLVTEIGIYIWTACAAGWTAIAYVTHVPEAWGVAAGCMFIAFIWKDLMEI